MFYFNHVAIYHGGIIEGEALRIKWRHWRQHWNFNQSVFPRQSVFCILGKIWLALCILGKIWLAHGLPTIFRRLRIHQNASPCIIPPWSPSFPRTLTPTSRSVASRKVHHYNWIILKYIINMKFMLEKVKILYTFKNI